MEFEISKAEFEKSLYLAQGVVERRNTLPILSNVLIEPAEGGLSLLATDLEVGVRRVCEAEVKGAGALSVNARKLYEIVKGVAADKIRLRTIEGHGVEISSGRSRFKLVGLDAKEFPSVPGLTTKPGKPSLSLQAPAKTLDQMIGSTLFAVSMDETRFNLSGVFVEGRDDLLRMVATDGHRLALVERQLKGHLPEKGVILPRKGLSEVKKVLEAPGCEEDPVTFTVDGTMARIERERVQLFMRLVEGEFPDYRQVIPKKGKIEVSLLRGDLLAALQRVSILSTERARGVRLTIRPGVMELQTSNPDLGEASEEIEVGYGGSELSIGFNARYLVEALLVMEGERVELSLNDEVSPGVMRAEGDEHYSYVVMPMRL